MSAVANDDDRVEARPPTREEWALLVARLTEARKVQLSAARATNLPDDLHADFAAVSFALSAVLELLRSQPDFVAGELTSPLLELVMALKDVEQGRASRLFIPHKRKNTATTKGALSTAESYLRASASMAMDALMEAGETRLGAARQVASVIKAARIPIRHRDLTAIANAVAGWRAAMMAGPDPTTGSAPEKSLEIWRSYKSDPSGFGAAPRDRAELFLRDLRTNPGYRFI